MSTFHRWDNFSLDAIQEISWLHKETCLREDTFVEFFERFICLEELPEYRGCLPWAYGNRMSLSFEHFFEGFDLSSLTWSISSFEYDESTRESMTVANIWTHSGRLFDFEYSIGDMSSTILCSSGFPWVAHHIFFQNIWQSQQWI